MARSVSDTDQSGKGMMNRTVPDAFRVGQLVDSCKMRSFMSHCGLYATRQLVL